MKFSAAPLVPINLELQAQAQFMGLRALQPWP